MGKIAICDDVPEMAQNLQKIVKDYLETSILGKGISEVQVYSEGTELINDASEYDIIFLDLEMPNMDGIEVGRQINKINPSAVIIIASGLPERFKETYEINTFRFVTKPYDEWEIHRALKAVEEKLAGGDVVLLHKDRRPYEIMQRDIIYIEAYNGYIRCHTSYGLCRSDVSLETLSEELDSNIFIRIHRKYIVNMNRIKEYKKGIVNIENVELKVSRERKKAFEKKWMFFGI